jgi:hypothetical protein
MCISDISASINTEIGDLTTVQLSQSYFTTLAPYPWRDESSKGIVSCSIFYVTESLQTKDRFNECVDFVYLFVGTGSAVDGALNGNLTTRKIHTSDGFNFVCDDNHQVLQWLSSNPITNQFIDADAAVPGTRLVSWANDLYQFVTVTSHSFQAVNQGIAVNWLTTKSNSYQLQNGIVVKGFTGDVCTCAPSASIQDIPCESSLSFCLSQSSAGSGQFVMNLSGSESIVGTTKTWQVTDIDGNLLIPETTASATALDGNLNLEIDQYFSCCTCSQHINITEMHVSNSVSESQLNVFAGALGSHPQGNVSKILFSREDGVAPLYTQGPYIGQAQGQMVITLSGSGGPQNGPAGYNPETPFNVNLAFAETRIVVPTGSTVEESVDNIVSHINASSSQVQYLTDVSASRNGTNLILHRTVMGPCLQHPQGIGWNAYYVNYKYFDAIGGVNNTTFQEAGQGNLSSGNGFLLGNVTGSAASSSVGTFGFNDDDNGSIQGSTAVTLSFTRSGCEPDESNLPQQLNVCYEESITLGSGIEGPLEATSSCCFFLQLNKAPFYNGSSSYCQSNEGRFIDLCEVFGACNYDTISYARNETLYPGNFLAKGPENICDTFQADPATLALGSMEMNFTASAFNIDCINSASGQPSMSSPFTPTSFDSPGQGCCSDVSASVTIYFNPRLVVADSVQCYPTMALDATTIYNFPLQGPVSWSIIGGDGSPSPHAIPGFIGNVAPDEIYTEGANLLQFNTATSHSINAEAYLNHHTSSGLYTASVSVTNGPCTFTKTFNVKMVSASSEAGPDIYFCDTHGGDASIHMAANGTTGFWQYLGGPPNTLPSIGNPTSPTTKIQQPACTSYEYSWTISSQSLHIVNEDTFSVICEDTDTMTVHTNKAVSSGSISGILTTTGETTASIYDASEITRAPYNINVVGCPPYEFSFTGDVDMNVNQVSWSVYMSESLALAGGSQPGPVESYPNKANDGVMGKFDQNNPTLFMIGGIRINSESNSENPGRAVNQAQSPAFFPSPNIISRVFKFSSSFSESYGNAHYISLTSKDTQCGCPQVNHGHGVTTYGTVVFLPTIENFDIVMPTPGATTAGHATSNESSFALSTNFQVTEPTLGITVPKYHNVIAMSFHSGSNHITPTTNSAVLAKGTYPGTAAAGNPMAPYLTMSVCSNIDYPIRPLKKQRHVSNTILEYNRDYIHAPLRGAPDQPNPTAPYWPGSASYPHRDSGLSSGSQEKLSFEWNYKEINTYRNDGTQYSPPALVTSSFTDTMQSFSFEESPTFFPALREADAVTGWPAAATGDLGGITGYNQLGGDYGAVASHSIELQCTMSRLSVLDGSTIQTLYASKSLMFTS